jgi:serine protease
MSVRYLMILSVLLMSQLLGAQNTDTFYPGQLWVQMQPTATAQLAHEVDKINLLEFEQIIGEEISEQFNLTKVRKPFHFANDASVSEVYQLFFDQGSEEAFARALQKLAVVNYAERVPVMRPTLTPNDLGPETGTNNQWSLWKINAQQAWDITTGNTQIKVAIVDDAVLTTHPDLIPNLIAGYDVADNDNNPMPNTTDMSHGTHVAGIVGAATNNGQGVASIGFNIKIMPVKSSNQAQIVTDAYGGVVWAYQNGANVINMSWGGSGFSQTGQNIINNAYAANCIMVAAAGNDGVSTTFYPAGYNNVISVASSTTNDAKSSFSNYGTWVDITAPGSAIRSTYIGNNFAPAYANLQGTSMASPLVAGLVGLVWSVNPQMSKVQVSNCVITTADNINSVNSGFIGQLGSGRINAYEAVLCALATVNAPPIPSFTADNTVSCPGGIVQFFGNSLGGLAEGFLWSFPGGNPATSTLQNPVVAYPNLGFYNVSLSVSNQFGSNVISEPGFIEVSSNGIDNFFSQDFETGTFAQMGWSQVNPDNGITWEIFTVAGTVSGTKAARVNLYNYPSAGQRDGLVSPVLDFSGHTNVKLDFQHAHRRRSQNFSDSLIVYVSTNGGLTFPNRVLAVSETGSGTFATNSILNANFIPSNGNDWCFGGEIGSGCFTVDLSDFDGQSNIKLKFETYNSTGNNIYLDNVNVSGNCVLEAAAQPVAGFSSATTAVCTGQSVQFFDQSSNIPSSYTWSFPGGTPSASSLPAPTVVYNQPGVYTVTLVVSNAFGSDQLTLTDYISVNVAPNLTVNAPVIISCAGEPVNLEASGAGAYSWAPATGLSSTTEASVVANLSAPLTYTVTGTTNGCSVTAQIEVQISPAPAVPLVVSQNNVGFVVTEPVSVQGHYGYLSNAAGWGNQPLANMNIEAPLVIARSALVADSLLCGAAINASEVAGKIAVVYRGGCEFGAKALNAQNAGAVGVIVVNNDGSALLEMAPGANGAAVNIPAIMVSNITGAWLNSEINAGGAVARLGQFNGGGLIICPGESILLAAPGGFGQYEWSDGTESAIIEVNEPGTYAVSVFNEIGCSAQSINYQVSQFNPTEPVISMNNQVLSANVSAVQYQWYFNGELIEGATGSTTPVIGLGEYVVVVVYSNGCSATSEPFEILTTFVAGLDEVLLSLYPVPTGDVLFVRLPEAVISTAYRLISADGKILANLNFSNTNNTNFELDVKALSTGYYILQIETNQGLLNARFIKQ